MLRWMFSELRRRGVLNAAGAYLVAGFGLLQGAEIALPRLGVPDWTVTALLVLVLAGFPVVCVVAWFFDIGLGGLTRTPAAAPSGPQAGRRRAALIVAGVAATALLGLTGWALVRPAGEERPPLRDEWLAIAPFRVSGEPSFDYLEEGMLDLLAAKLTGEGGLRAVEPRALLAAWRQRAQGSEADARHVARSLGAGRVLLGSALATGSTIVLAARILDTETGSMLANFEARGEASSLPALVDRFAGGLLAQLAGVEPERLRALEQTPFLALRAYLEGQRLLRAGRFLEAKGAFAEAQQIDSTFALPGVFHAIAASFTTQWSSAGAELAWRHRAALAPRDQLLLEAFLGANYPDWSSRPSNAQHFERLTTLSPDRAEAWYLRGDFVYHSDLSTPLPERLVRAAGFFATATALDDHFGPADIHLFEIALLRGDSVRAIGHATSFLAFAPDGDLAEYTRWYLDRLRGQPLRPWPADEPFVIMRMFAGTMAAQLAVGLDVSDAVVEWGVRTATDADYFLLSEAPLYMLNRGRPQRAAAIVGERQLGPEIGGPAAAVFRALYWETGEDLESLEPVADRLAGAARSRSDIDGHDWREAACAAAQYHGARGRAELVAEMADVLATAADRSTAEGRYARGCHALLGVIRAEAAALTAAVAHLDAVYGEGVMAEPWLRDATALVLAAGYERLGEPARALDAVRRRTVGIPHGRFLSTQLRTEGRLAAQLGRTAEAVRAYEHYLALRADVDPAVAPIVAQVRAEFAALAPDQPSTNRKPAP
jgi:TolB-like protein